MDIEITAIIISVLLLGFLIGRLSLSGKKSVNKTEEFTNCSESYIQGLNYLLANKSDKAIQLFVDLIKIDSDTIETHLALGNLFRSKGEVDRAIKIHQNLIARPNLESKQRVMALSELAEDYFKAGLLDRAENLFKELIQIDAENVAALNKLLEIYTVENSWHDALAVATTLLELDIPQSRLIVTHCYCEIAETYLATGNLKEARESLNKAVQIDNNCMRASLLLIDVYVKNDDYTKANKILQQLLKAYPDRIMLLIKPAREIYLNSGSIAAYQTFLQDQYEKSPETHVAVELLESYQSSEKHYELIAFLQRAIDDTKSLDIYDFAFRYFKNRPMESREKWWELTSQFHRLKQTKAAFLCTVCGYETHVIQWQCPSCKTWSSFNPL